MQNSLEQFNAPKAKVLCHPNQTYHRPSYDSDSNTIFEKKEKLMLINL